MKKTLLASALALTAIAASAATYEISNGPETVYGDPADFMVGNFNNPVIETGSTADFMPMDGAYAHSGTQALYTNVELNGLNSISNGEVTKAEIQDITFLVSAEDGMYFFNGETFETTVYVENTEASQFVKDSSDKYKWFDYSTEHKGSVTIDFTEEEWEYFTWGYGGVYPVTIHLETPIIYEGNSLLFTWVTESDCGGETWVNGTAALRTGGIQGANMASDSQTFAQSKATGYPKNTWSYVPVLKLHYVPVTEKGGTTVTPVSFENVTLSLIESPVQVGTTEKANAIALSFEINDPSDCGSYDIKLGTTSLGTITSTEGSIAYIGIPAGDAITLNVVPAGEGTIGVPYEISKSEIEALFPAPIMEVSATSFGNSQYELANLPESLTLTGAAQFFFSNYEDVPVSQFNWLDLMNPGDKNVSILRNASGPMADLMTAYTADYKNVQLNEGKIALSKTDAITAAIDANTGAVKSYSGYLYFSLAIDYPLYYSSTPVLTQGSALPTVSASALQAMTIQKKYDNGASYGSNQLRAEFNSISHPGELDVIHPETLIWEWYDETNSIKIVGPKDTSLHYKKAGDTSAVALADEDGFTKHENDLPIMIVNIEDYSGATLHVQARKADGGVHSELYLNIDDLTTGVKGIEMEGSIDAEFYNLQGVRVNGIPTPGIYILRQGNKTTKVIVK